MMILGNIRRQSTYQPALNKDGNRVADQNTQMFPDVVVFQNRDTRSDRENNQKPWSQQTPFHTISSLTTKR